MYYLGIDPGRTTGIALYNPVSKKLISLNSGDFWQSLQIIGDLSSQYKIDKVLVENPQLNKPVFMNQDQRVELKDAIIDAESYARKDKEQFNAAFQRVESVYKIHTARAQRVGRNKEQTHLLLEWLDRKGFEVVEMRPHLPKMDSKQFNELTGWTGRTNEHVRDAARLVYGL